MAHASVQTDGAEIAICALLDVSVPRVKAFVQCPPTSLAVSIPKKRATAEGFAVRVCSEMAVAQTARVLTLVVLAGNVALVITSTNTLKLGKYSTSLSALLALLD